MGSMLRVWLALPHQNQWDALGDTSCRHVSIIALEVRPPYWPEEVAYLVDLRDPTKMIGKNVAFMVEGKEGAPERGLLNSWPDFPSDLLLLCYYGSNNSSGSGDKDKWTQLRSGHSGVISEAPDTSRGSQSLEGLHIAVPPPDLSPALPSPPWGVFLSFSRASTNKNAGQFSSALTREIFNTQELRRDGDGEASRKDGWDCWLWEWAVFPLPWSQPGTKASLSLMLDISIIN